MTKEKERGEESFDKGMCTWLNSRGRAHEEVKNEMRSCEYTQHRTQWKRNTWQSDQRRRMCTQVHVSRNGDKRICEHVQKIGEGIE